VIGQVQPLPAVVTASLAASRGRVLAMVLTQGMSLVAAGLLAGLAAACAAGRLVADQLFAVSATDPAVYLGAPLLLAVIALAAHWLPARRATRVDPFAALRVE
jgi:putative ABC transport system permease protein